MPARSLYSTIISALLTVILASAFSGDEPVTPRPKRNDAWRILGMGGGGTVYDPHISPHDPKLIVCRCDMTGGYISKDGGDTWRMFNLRTGIGSFAFDPIDPNVIYAGNVGLWKSSDRGDTWKLIWPDPAKTKEYCRDDHGEYILQSDDPLYPKSSDAFIEAIGLDGAEHKIWIAMNGSILDSRDGGKSWSFETTAQNVSSFWAWPGMSVYAETQIKSLESDGKETSWRTNELPEKLLAVSHGSFHTFTAAQYAHVTYSLTPTSWSGNKLVGGLGKSSGDFADKIINPGQGDPPKFIQVACCATQAKIVYVSFMGLRLAEGPEGVYNGIAKSIDAGKTWNIVFKESTKPAENLDGSWIEPRMRQGDSNLWFDAARGLAVAPSDPNFVIATDCFRTYRTRDGGAHWEKDQFRPGARPPPPPPPPPPPFWSGPEE